MRVADVAQGREPVLRIGDDPILIIKDEEVLRVLVGGNEVVRTEDVFQDTANDMVRMGGPLTIKHGFED